jgi:hypothetical protein
MLRRAFCWLDTRRLAAIVLFLAIFTMAVRPPAGTDTWWHLQAGRVTLEQSHILQTDRFSHTRYGSPWVNHSWLSQVILYWLFDRFSYAGLGLLMGALVTAAFAFVYLQTEGSVFTRAFILVAAAATSAVIWSARPQLFSFLLTAVVAYLLYLFKWRGVNRLWLLPPLFALWVNLHAGYALGFMVLAAFVAGEVFNRLLEPLIPADDPIIDWQAILWVLAIAVLSALFLVINPNTTRMWTYYLETVRIDVLQDFIQEWRSPDFHLLRMQPFIWLVLGTMAAMGFSSRRVDGTDLALMSGFAYAGLLAARNIAPFALVAAPVLSRHVTAIASRSWQTGTEGIPGNRLRKPVTSAQAAINWTMLVLVVALAVVKTWQPLQTTFNEARLQETLPAGAVAWIEEHQPEGKMFNHYNWGGYLIWHLWPDYRVFVDGRTDLYGNDFLRQYLRVQSVRPGFAQVLEAQDVDWVLVPSAGALSTQLACRAEWSEAYRDDVAIIWIRSGASQ